MPIVEVSLPMVGRGYGENRKSWYSNYHNAKATGPLSVRASRLNALESPELKWLVVAVVLQN